MMTEREIVELLRTNWTGFGGLPKAVQEWILSHKTTCVWLRHLGAPHGYYCENGPVDDADIVRVRDGYQLPEPKKQPKRYPVELVCAIGAQPELGGCWMVALGDYANVDIARIYSCGKTPVWHFADSSTHYAFRRNGGKVAIAVSFKEDM